MALIPIRASGTLGNVDSSHTYTLELRKTAYSSGSIDLRLDGIGIEYLGGDANAYDPVKGSRLSFSFIVRTTNEKILLQELENSEMFTFAVILKEDSVIQWRGWVYPEQISRSIRYNGMATVQAGDALALLRNTNDYPPRLTLIGVFEAMIRDNNSDRSGYYFSRLYDNGDEVVRDNLGWVDIFFSQYFKAHTQSITHFQNITNMDEFIRIILRSWGLRIFQGEGGVYWIDHVPSRYSGSAEFKEYNYDTGLSVGTIEPTSGTTSVDFEVELDKVYAAQSSYRTQPIYNRINFRLISNAPADTFTFSAAQAIADGTNTLTVGATYTNNSSTFEIIFIPGYLTQEQRNTYEIRQSDTIWAQRTAGTNDPDAKGTLTKSTGTGPSTIDYSSAGPSDRTVVDDLSEDISNDSFYSLDIPFQEVLSYTPPSAIADSSDFNNFKYGGFNAVALTVAVQGTITSPQSFGTALIASGLDTWDLITGGDFQNGDESNWTSNGCVASTPAADGTMRVTSTGSGGDDSVYQAISTVGSEEYVAIIEMTNAVPNASNGYWRFGVNNSTSPVWGANLGEYDFGNNDQEYAFVEFTATGGTTYIHIGNITGASNGDYVDFSNCKVVHKDSLSKQEELLINEYKQHYQLPRKIYNLTFRGSHHFNDTFIFGDDILIPNTFTFNIKKKEISGDFVSIANDDFVYWAGTSFNTLLNNGESNNSVSKPSGSNPAIKSQQVLLGGYFNLEFYTTDSIMGTSVDSIIGIGLNDTATSPVAATGIDYSWYLFDDVSAVKQIKVYEGGVQKYTENYSFDGDDKFNIIWDGATLKYYLNDVLKYTSLQPTTIPTYSLVFPLDVRCTLDSNGLFGVQKVKLRGQAMRNTYQE